jgi:hypothetical protein
MLFQFVFSERLTGFSYEYYNQREGLIILFIYLKKTMENLNSIGSLLITIVKGILNLLV